MDQKEKATMTEETNKGFRFPTAYTILFLLIIIVAVGTWFIPAGSYDYNEDGEPIPGTYHQVEQNPQRILTDAMLSPIDGMYGIQDENGDVNIYNSGDLYGAIDGALFVLIIGGFLAVTMKTGAIDAGIAYITRYAERVRNNPTKSLVYDQKADNEKYFLKSKEQDEFTEFTSRRKVILALFGLAFLVMIYGVIPWQDIGIPLPQLDWWFGELTALLLFFAIVIGLIGRMGEENLVSTFVDGARDMLGVALIVGLARGISVVMNNGLITDTVLYWAESALSGLGGVAFINVTHLIYLPLSFLIPSSSGLATVSMPIMDPLGDLARVNRALIVTAYQSANGLLNLFTPTSAVVMGGLALGRVDFVKWLRFVLPILIMLLVLYGLVLSIAVLF
jgi:uncharacterized ion transporter superfamily protein YfcC